ncbi:MAG: alkaline phosphatase family protein [Gemmatimonadetes bacterium]|nr:alkaline phosphatase family protein [Gemmatimonadota bacterium]MYG85916.1 alkaline phosphatase family protein [Gemmatimonadota bacterium]MYJ89269.1 alkaline phosphatase family protein [Gemmatimonadota bacterium]
MSITGFTRTGLILSFILLITPASAVYANGETVLREAAGPTAPTDPPAQSSASAPTNPPAQSSASAPTDPPRLAVLIIIDQFRHDYLQRFDDLFVEDGFRRFMDRGAWMQDARFTHVHASTSPGHSVVTSGTYAYKTGMVNNAWYSRSTGVFRPSLVDPESHILGLWPTATGRASTRELVGSSLADELRMATRYRGKAITISLKDYSAMISAGKLGAPYWFEAGLGRITSSSFFMDDLPDWVKRFNDRNIPNQSFGRTWDRLLPEELYLERAGKDVREGEEDNRNSGIVFPHVTKGGLEEPGPRYWNAFKHTPWSTDYQLEFARQAIIEEELGQDDTPDVLVISLSANDYIGHDFGPFSQESMDATLRTDRQLADFFAFLDERVGRDRTLLVLTADHGALELPEQLALRGLEAGRAGPEPLTALVEEALDGLHGEDDWVLHVAESGVYLNWEAIDSRGLSRADVEETAAAAVVTHPAVWKAYTRHRIERRLLPESDLTKTVYHSFHSENSGDIMLISTPFYLLLGEYGSATVGTSHGWPHDYDTHIPIMFHGPWIAPGHYRNRVDAADITPTICNLLRITLPSNRDGRILGEILR